MSTKPLDKSHHGDLDGPLLLTLLMGNNNNNHLANGEAIPDSLSPQYFAVELKPSPGDNEEEAINVDPSFANSNGEDGPLLLGLVLCNQNNNNHGGNRADGFTAIPDTLDPRHVALELKFSRRDVEEAIDNVPSSVSGEDVPPLLVALSLDNQNHNNNPNTPNLGPPVNNLESGNIAFQSKLPVSDSAESIEPSVRGDDGPLFFALTFNQNNNNTSTSAISLENGTFLDTLDPRDIGLKLRSMDGNILQAIDLPVNGHDGPLLMTLLFNNLDQNQDSVTDNTILDTLVPQHAALELDAPKNHGEESIGSHGTLNSSLPLNSNNHKSGDSITEAIPDVLEMKPQLLELHSGDSIMEVIPDAMEMKSQLLDLHPHGNDITEAIPVTFKWKSQVIQGCLVPVKRARKVDMENLPHQKTGTPLVVEDTTLKSESANLVPRSHVAPDDSNKGRLSEGQLQFWRDNGYLVIPNALPSDQKDLLLKTVYDAAETLARGGERVQKHSYLPGQESYVHPCGRAIATLTDYAFEPDIEPLKRIQRLGCGVHRVMPPFRKAILTPFHVTLAKALGYKDPRIIQSLIIVKAAEVGARVIPHQDGCSGFTDPSSCTTFWYALEDCTTENGCLAVAPGSHRTQPITRRCRTGKNGRPEFVDLDRPLFAEIEDVSDTTLPRKNENGEFDYKKLEVEAGTLVLMHGNLMHTSEANYSSKSRVAFNFGIVEGEHDWLEDNYLQPYDGGTEFEKLNAK